MINYQSIESSLIPEIESLVGTPAVDAREIASVFSGTQKAIDLVNRIDGSLLKNIAYIYNEREAGAYGVFNPNLDKTVKWLMVKNQLDKQGFKTMIGPDQKLYAFAPNMTKEQIEEKMESAFESEERTGGITIGININNILRTADQITSMPENNSLTPEQKDNLKVAQLASVIAHEAVHAKGDTGEGGPEQVQDSVLRAALKILGIPVQLTGQKMHAASMGWYKRAQVGSPFSPFSRNVAIEPRLRENQERSALIFPTHKKKDDSLETVLNNNTHKNNPEQETESQEEELEKDRYPVDSKTTESILNEKRTHPLILPIPKAADSDSMIKVAGWSSNVGGYGIGGVLTPGSATSQFLPNSAEGLWLEPFEADEIKDKNYTDENTGFSYWRRRYDPLCARGAIAKDKFGRAFFNWDVQIDLASLEFRNRPMPWHDRDPYWPNRPDIAVVGSTIKSIYNPVGDDAKRIIVQVLRKAGYYKQLVRSGKRKAARLLVSEELMSHLTDALMDIPHLVLSYNGKYVVWIFMGVSEDEIREAEQNIRNKTNQEKVNGFVGLSDDIRENINMIMSKSKILCKEHGMSDVYVVGGFVRTLAGTKNMTEVNDLDFSSPHPTNSLKLGGLLAADLGIYEVGYHHKSKTMTIEHDGIKMDFRGDYVPLDIRPLLRERGIETTPLNFDIYARDFTVNSLIYSFMDNKIYDVTKSGIEDLQARRIRTFFDPNIIIPLNPLLITRAIILNLRGFSIDSQLDLALKKNSHEIFNGKESNERLAYEYEKISGYGEDGKIMLKEYDLSNLKNIRDKVAAEQPELFEKEDN